jgi:hypothetical protein
MTPKPRSAAPRPCRRHAWYYYDLDGAPFPGICQLCGKLKDAALSKRGRNNRKRGNSHELSVARKYGGEKVGQLGLPEDIRGGEYRTQVKTHQRPAPAEWRKAFAALEAVTDNRTPRLIVRFLQPGVPADDYIIIKGSTWLDRFGRDEEEPNRAA